MKKKFLAVFVFITVSLFAFAEINIINPIKGVWANRQMLVIDTSDGADYFYSLDGSDPALQGFAYDGPVSIDLTGNITVRVTRGFKEQKEVNFSVFPVSPSDEIERNFTYSFSDTGILNYFSGSEIQIPETMEYSFEQNPENFISGRVLKYSESCSLSRFIPCTVSNGSAFWRFFIKTSPKSSGSFSRRDLPVTIINWNTISFDDENLIYKLDDEYWTLPKENRVIDRSKSHVIYWQNIAYEVGNPIEFYEIPPMPDLKTKIQEDGSVVFFIEGDSSYSMSFKNTDNSYCELFSELCADTFYGDIVSSSAEIDVYSDSVYQGTLLEEYEVDKRHAPYPVIISNAEGFHSRGTVNVNITSPGNAELFVGISEPVILIDSIESFNPDKTDFKNIKVNDFTGVGSSINLVLEPFGEKPVFYKVQAYTVAGKTKSPVAEYTVVIDSYNFYFNSNADKETADGSKEHPFVDIEQGFPFIKEFRSASLYIFGTVKMPDWKIELDSNWEIKGMDNACIQFPKNSTLMVRGSTIQITDCRLQASGNSGNKSASGSIIRLDNSVLSMEDCEITSSGGKNMNFIDARNSVVSLSDSLFSVSASTYACLLNSTNTRVNVNACKIGIVGETAVAFSIRGSETVLASSSIRVTGNLGRVAEFFEVNAKIISNEFSADLKRVSGVVDPIYSDKKSKVYDSENFSQGF
ncbi:MAG: hypothetical protein HUK25_10570 [Treponema sp.]|nr:hypothetical protein [Treponema sp.]